MNDTDKLLRAFIEASGYEIEEAGGIKRYYRPEDIMDNGKPKENAMPEAVIYNTDYKLTKREFNSKPTLHKIIRQYESGFMSASEMIGRIVLLEGVTDEEI